MGRFETRNPDPEGDLSSPTDLSGRRIDAVHARRPSKALVLDMDSSVSPTHGDQEGTACNGHFGCPCYHPLFVFNQFGDLERCSLRSGNAHSADGWRDVLEPVVTRYRDKAKRRFFRADAAFALPVTVQSSRPFAQHRVVTRQNFRLLILHISTTSRSCTDLFDTLSEESKNFTIADKHRAPIYISIGRNQVDSAVGTVCAYHSNLREAAPSPVSSQPLRM